MRLDRRGVPSAVLNGRVRKYIQVHNLYRAIMSREIMRQVNISFWARAKRGSDDLGNKWKPLSPKTHAYKPLSPMERKTYTLGNRLTRGLLTPSQDRLWRGIYARELKRLEKRGVANPEKKAAEKAWGILKSRGARTLIGLGRITDTNIRTGALVAATRPGSVANNRYYPPKNQIVEIRPRSIRIRFNISYIKEVDKVRPVIPDDISPWVLKAHEIAILEAKSLYERLKNIANDNKGSTQTRNNTRSKTRRNKRPPRR